MKFWDYCKGKAAVLLLNAAALPVLCVYLLLLHNTGTEVFLIAFVWIAVLLLYLLVQFLSRRKYFRELMSVLDRLDQKYLIAEVMEPGNGPEDKLYWEILRKSNKSVLEKIHGLEDGQREYKEYIESWIHEVKVPITAAHLICENNRNDQTNRILAELDEIENEVEKVLYFARMEQVYQDYLIRPVNLRQTVLSAISTEKRHFIQCGIEIELEMEETVVSTDEKWIEFILRQIFSNSMKYRRDEGAKIRIYTEKGERQKSLIVEDNGIGIAEDDIGRIFEKGFTGKNGRSTGISKESGNMQEDGRSARNSHATGMGLYLCARLCGRLGIGIACRSEKGKYTRMILTFPDSEHNKIA